MHDSDVPNMNDEPNTLGDVAPRVACVAAIVGVIALGVGAGLGHARGDGMRYFLHTYLVSYCFLLSISLGALLFVAMQHASRAGWSVTVRRIAEVLAGNFPLLAILFVPVVLGMSRLYPWANPEAVAASELIQGKAAYLNVPFFIGRCVAYFAVWWALGRFFLTRSTEQDASGSPELTVRMERMSPVALLLLAGTLTFASFDLLMSLTPEWFSTIFGVYYFSGAIVGALAVMIVAAMLLQTIGRVPRAITVEHYHELGKLLFAFVIFWGYIAFSQYMLIWYANIPEETIWYLARQTGGPDAGGPGSNGVVGPWAVVSIALLAGHLLIPLLGLLSRHVKRNKMLLTGWALWVLVFHWIDIYWLVMPSLGTPGIPFGLIDVCCLVGLGGIYVAATVRIAGRRALIPLRDPRLDEALAFENY